MMESSAVSLKELQHDGTVVLHSAPESAAGGPLALVQDGT